MKFEVVDACPVPTGAAPFVVEAKRRSGQVLQSCFRGAEARAILARFGKHDQAYLYNGWVRRLPGFNPANPPGFSTHECFNDGPAFPGRRRGARIPEALVGQDWSNAWKVVAAYRAMGVNAALTYPTSVREKQHINIRVVPKKLKPALKRGDGKKGGGGIRKRVRLITGRLTYCAVPHSGGKVRYLDGRRREFDAETEKAVKHFQRDHGLKPDGIVGEMTEHQLDLAYHHWYKVRHRDTKKPPPRTQPPPIIDPPKKVTLKGVDVSVHQGDIDWGKVKADGISFAFVKATEGIDYEDPRLTAKRVAAMRKAHLGIGFYHFARPQKGRSAVAEAQHFVRVVKGVGGFEKGDFAPVLDIEWVQGLGQAELRKWAKSFCDECRRLTGAEVAILYTGAWFWNPRTGNPAKGFGKTALWLAAYVKDPTSFVPRAWKRWTIWQHSDKGRVNGISTPVDVDVFTGTTDDLKRLTLH